MRAPNPARVACRYTGPVGRPHVILSRTGKSYAVIDAAGGSPYNEGHDCRWGDRFLPCICF
jgi:hypothetical protein